MSYTIAESIKQLSAFIGHPGIEEIINGLQEIESGNSDEEIIQKLRRKLNAILPKDESKAIMTEDVSLAGAVYYTLITLARLYPLNQEDDTFTQAPFTQEEIENGGLIHISTGHRFSPGSLVRWINEGPGAGRKAYSNPATREELHPRDQAAIYQKCVEKGIVLISPGEAAAQEAPIIAWLTAASWLETALQGRDINDAQVAADALDIARGLETAIRPIADYDQLTVDAQELVNWQAAAWRVLLRVLEVAPQEAVASSTRELATVLATVTRELATDDPQTAVARKTAACSAVFALLVANVREAMSEIAVNDAVDARVVREAAILLEVAMREAAAEGVTVDARVVREAAAALEAAVEAAEKITGREAPERDEQLIPVVTQTSFFQPEPLESPVCRMLIGPFQEGRAREGILMRCVIDHCKCVRFLSIGYFESNDNYMLSVSAGTPDSSYSSPASTPDRNRAFRQELLQAGFTEESRDNVKIRFPRDDGNRGGNAFVMLADAQTINKALQKMIEVIERLEGDQVLDGYKVPMLGALSSFLPKQNNLPVPR